MAVEICTESPTLGLSPRLSFSYDLNQSDIASNEPRTPLKSSLIDYDYDFDFGVNRRSYEQESSLADELFENGIILPIQIKRKNLPLKLKSVSTTFSSSSSCLLPPLPPSSSVLSNTETETPKETEEKQGNSSSSKNSFWGFKRSKSLNCGSIYRRGLCPLPLLSRSKSAGSTASSKRSLISKDESTSHNGVKQSTQKNSNSNSNHHKKPPLKKNYGSSYSSKAVHVSPVLNVSTGNLLGFGSFFSKTKKK